MHNRFSIQRLATALLAVGAVCAGSLLQPGSASANDGQLVLHIVDKETGDPLPCRVHLKNASGRPVRVPHTIA